MSYVPIVVCSHFHANIFLAEWHLTALRTCLMLLHIIYGVYGVCYGGCKKQQQQQNPKIKQNTFF